MPFIHDDFLLGTKTARRLYHQFAESEPIFDYHCHLSPKDIAQNRRFNNLFEIWLEGDHYKWRAMRSNGVPETYCTGMATPQEKFKAWAATVNGWTSLQFVSALRHDQSNPEFNPSFRQLLHVSFKVAAKKGDRYLNALKKHEVIVGRNVTENLFARHMKPLLLGQ